ncbi:glycosyltransferase family 39 protein [Priestia filamentosa]|uniref:glycosyltransferase family 39 protein n=1 Tax=Priestia filamentosa TaxID=1402861 RepID=UPI000E7436EF|nr:glycosyltransferase family 39 protein [Priestia filamentosa]RJS64335.1 mannosyltransferase [Priestia filamentosa]
MKKFMYKRMDLILLGIILLSAFLNIYNIWKNDYANAYYTAAVKSMLENFHNFFYASFDPAGFVTVDKPPLTFWIQTLSAAIFGLHGWSVMLPQALAGVGSVILLYFLLKPTFGITGARIASLTMAITPIVPAISRSNNIDSMLVFTLLIGVWMLFKGVRKNKAIWIIGAFAMIGLGFNMKMMQAFMVAPAFYLFYITAAKVKWKKKIGILASATAVMMALSLSWAVVVDSVSADDRPYMGSSQTNSVLELAFGYNGVARLTGQGQGTPGGGGAGADKGNGGEMQAPPNGMEQGEAPEGMPSGAPQNGQGGPNQANDTNTTNSDNSASNDSSNTDSSSTQDSTNSETHTSEGNGQRDFLNRGDQGGPGGQNGGGMFNTGTPGFFRLFQIGLADQISWVLPFALFGCVGLLSGIRLRKQWSDEEKESLFWLAWLGPVGVFFSIAGFFHQYYLIMLAPPIAAFVGAGWVKLFKLYQTEKGFKSMLLPIAILATTAFEVFTLKSYIDQIGMVWSIGVGVAGTLLSLALFFFKQKEKRATYFVSLAALLAILVIPAFWASTPIIYGDGNSVMPAAGPTTMGNGNMKIGEGQNSINENLVSYLKKHSDGETYLFATSNASSAAPYIIEGETVMAMGGFSGSDPILTTEKLEEMVKNNEVKYFLIGGGGPGGSSDLQTWIKENGEEVPQEEWNGTSNSDSESDSNSGMPGRGGQSETLYKVEL